MDERKELARRLRQMAVTTGDLSCLGCGYERGCSVHGCAVLRRAADLIAPEVDITKPIPLEELRAAAAERPVLVYFLCVHATGSAAGLAHKSLPAGWTSTMPRRMRPSAGT